MLNSFVMLLLGIIAALGIACIVLAVLVFRLRRQLKMHQGSKEQADAAAVCRQCARLFPASENQCPYCGTKRGVR